MPDATTVELARALLRGDAALWLGPQWHPPTDPADARLLGTLPWLGIWAESQDPVMLQLLMTFKGPAPRLLIDVPDRIDAVLGDHYSFANVCPYFYLRGPQGIATRPRSILHRRARDAKVEQLVRLGPSVLIVTGYDEADDLAEALGEIDEVAPDLRLIAAVGMNPEKIARLQEAAHATLAGRLRLTGTTLCDLIHDIEQLRAELPPEPALLLGHTKVPLAPFVRRESPVDEEFLLLTEQDTQLPRPGENARDLIAHLISGRGRPWRALAHGLEWKRPLPHLQRSREALDKVKHGKADVVCLDIPAESGSGLTTLLEAIAFEAASEGSPALFYRGSASMNYDALRAFLTDLYQYEGLSAADQATPSLLVFDAQAVAADAMGLLSELPSRLSRDGRRAVIIRGVPVLQSEDDAAVEQRIRPAPKSGRGVESAVLTRLAADLGPAQQADLVRWVTEIHTRIGAPVPPESVETIQRWNFGVARIPLLVCLYFILQGHYQEVARLGSHLVKRAKEGLGFSQGPSAAPEAGDRVLTGVELLRAITSLQDGLASGRFVEPQPNPEQVGDVLMTLSVFGSLMVQVPRHVLADVVGVAPDSMLRVLLHLERKELIETSHAPIARANEDRLAPIAYYSTHESVALRHAAYGRMILCWLLSDEGAGDLAGFCPDGGQAASIASDVASAGRKRFLLRGRTCTLPEYPIELLEPVFRRLQPKPAHVRFADEFALLYLRLQKNRERRGYPGLVTWQWSNKERLCEALGWLSEQVVSESPSLLHSRGITTYKCTRQNLPIAEVRRMYESAVADFTRAVELAREHGGENPGNILTSLGLLYAGWTERERNEGHVDRCRELDEKIEQTLRSGLSERPDNPFAAYGLARYLVDRLVRGRGSPERPAAERVAGDLAEAIDLLSCEPEAYFEDEWNELKREAIQLLDDAETGRLVERLKNDRNDLGFALQALRALNGEIPDSPTAVTLDAREIVTALDILKAAEQDPQIRLCALGNLLRYALFSAHPDRLTGPAYRERYTLISRLDGTIYLDRPVWLFDYAMLSCQVGKFEQASDAFAVLRRGKRFFEVPRERECFLAERPDTVRPLRVNIRIVSAGDPEARGWCRVAHPVVFRDPIPFSVRSFQSRGKNTRVGATTTAYVAIRPAGPFAEPEPPRA